MAFELRYHPEVKSSDTPLLDAKMKTRIRNAIEAIRRSENADTYKNLA